MKEGKIMSLGDKIRSMTNKELASFIWWYDVNTITSFLQHGGKEIKNYSEIKEWLEEDYNPDDPWFASPK